MNKSTMFMTILVSDIFMREIYLCKSSTSRINLYYIKFYCAMQYNA